MHNYLGVQAFGTSWGRAKGRVLNYFIDLFGRID